MQIIEFDSPAVVAEVEPKGQEFVEFTTDAFKLPDDGQYAIKIEGLNPYKGDDTALVDAVTLNAVLVDNTSFEEPKVDNFEVAPEESGWSWTGGAGIASKGEFIGDEAQVPEGEQVAFITNEGAMFQTGTVAAGEYTLSFQVAQRASGNDSSQVLRVTLQPLSSNKTFLWSGNTIAEERDITGSVVKRRFFAEGQRNVGEIGSPKYFYTRDHLGSIREVTTDTGNVVARFDYDAWGKQTTTSGNPTASDFRFTGHYVHALSGMNLTRTREYRPDLARWVRRDPLGEAAGVNLYHYVFEDPINLTDVSGLDVIRYRDPWTSPNGMGLWPDPRKVDMT